jgi:hypothetical protein
MLRRDGLLVSWSAAANISRHAAVPLMAAANPDKRNQLHHDFLEHVSRRTGRDVAQRAFDLLGLLPENFLDLPVIPRPPIGIGLHYGPLICHSDKGWRGSGKIG